MDAETESKSESAEAIEPIPFRPAASSRRPGRSTAFKWLVIGTAGAGLIFLLAAAWFVFTARQVTLDITPPPDQIEIDGGLAAPGIGDSYLMRPGRYTLIAKTRCYQPLQHEFRVTDTDGQTVQATMDRLAGRLALELHPRDATPAALTGLKVYVDDVLVAEDALSPLKVAAGSRRIRIVADRHQDYSADITIEGCDVLQTHRVDLLPDWSPVSVNSTPAGEQLVRHAIRKKVAFICMGIRKRSKVGKLIFGSTVQYVILNAPCPVLTTG